MKREWIRSTPTERDREPGVALFDAEGRLCARVAPDGDLFRLAAYQLDGGGNVLARFLTEEAAIAWANKRGVGETGLGVRPTPVLPAGSVASQAAVIAVIDEMISNYRKGDASGWMLVDWLESFKPGGTRGHKSAADKVGGAQ